MNGKDDCERNIWHGVLSILPFGYLYGDAFDGKGFIFYYKT